MNCVHLHIKLSDDSFRCVTSLAVPSARPDVLISGGGDQFLLSWDYEKGEILHRANIADLFHDTLPDFPASDVMVRLLMASPTLNRLVLLLEQ
jgi:hypothetical protein